MKEILLRRVSEAEIGELTPKAAARLLDSRRTLDRKRNISYAVDKIGDRQQNVFVALFRGRLQ